MPRICFRISAADEQDFVRFVSRNIERGGLFLFTRTPHPVGTELELEVQVRTTHELLCSASAVVRRSDAAEAGAAQPGMLIAVERIQPGCDEDLRRALERVRFAPGTREHAPDPKVPVIGIDLGTTNTCAAVVENGHAKIIRSRLGYSTIPSMLTFDAAGTPVVGQSAEKRLALHPRSVAHGTKRFIGRPYSKALAQQLAAHVSYEVVPDAREMASIKLDHRVLSPIEVGACVLAEIKRVADAELDQPIRHAVVTVPAAFTENQRTAVREAASRANLEILRIVNEPTAAALSFGYGRKQQKTVLVYDLGGGTFDVSILEIDDTVYAVLATAGDTFLGGIDFDRLIAGEIRKHLARTCGKIALDATSEERILLAAREAKHVLSELPRAEVLLPNLLVLGAARPAVDLACSIERSEFEALAAPLVERTVATCRKALDIARLKPSDIGDVLLVGGQTRMPLVSRRIEALFGRPPSKRVHPDEVVALGASILATLFHTGSAPLLLDVLPLPIGVARHDGSFEPVLLRNVTLPAQATLAVPVPARRSFEIAVFQGESPRAADNEFLGAFSVALPQGAAPPSLELAFHLDLECILEVCSRLPDGREVVHKLSAQHKVEDVLERIGSAHRPGPA